MGRTLKYICLYNCPETESDTDSESVVSVSADPYLCLFCNLECRRVERRQRVI